MSNPNPYTNHRNKERARTALRAVMSTPDYDEHDLRNSIVDLVTNIRHLCECKTIDFDAIVEISRQHWEAEK